MRPSRRDGSRSLSKRQNSRGQTMKEVDAGLFSAVLMGERSGIQKWLDRGANLHAVNKRGQTALMLCSNVETLGWLIGEGMDVNGRDNRRHTALFEAAVRDNPQFVRLLLDHGADVNVRSDWGTTALYEAAVWHKPQNVRLLLDYGAEADKPSDSESEQFDPILLPHQQPFEIT